MRPVVADASALVEYLLRTGRAAGVREVVEGAEIDLHVPALCDVEVAAALRNARFRRLLSEERARSALIDFLDLPLVRHGHQALLARILELAGNFSAYDATYVALAERIAVPLLTADRRLVRAARLYTGVSILET